MQVGWSKSAGEVNPLATREFFIFIFSPLGMQVGWNRVSWLVWAAEVNPLGTREFIWLDLEHCAHLLSAPLDLRHFFPFSFLYFFPLFFWVRVSFSGLT